MRTVGLEREGATWRIRTTGEVGSFDSSALTRPASMHSPDGTHRPYWLLRPLKPSRDAYRLSR